MSQRWKPQEPHLEVVQIVEGSSFTAWAHGLPFHTVRWHFHPEYELHLVTYTNGQYFVGDFIGEFTPGHLVLTGPNLPHHWLSHVDEDAIIPERGIVVQFTEEFVSRAIAAFPELTLVRQVLDQSRWGVCFPLHTGHELRPVLVDLIAATGPRKISLFLEVLHRLVQAQPRQMLAGADYTPNPTGYLSLGMNRVLRHIANNPISPGSEVALAEIAELSRSAFSRSFKAYTGMTPVQYINRLRVNFACQLLTSDLQKPIIQICFECGFNNLSNFNRQFLALKGLSPSQFRSNHPASARARQRA